MTRNSTIILLFTALLLSTLSSCLGKSDEQSSFAVSLYTRASDLEHPETPVVFSGASCRFDVRKNEKEKTLSITLLAKLTDNLSLDFQTGYMPLTENQNGVHTFNCASVQQTGHTITNLNGTIDFNGAVHISYLVDGRYRVSTISAPYYCYGMVELINPGMQPVIFSESPVSFGMTTTEGNKAVLRVYNITLDGKAYYAVQLEDLNISATADGYHLSASGATLKAIESDDNSYTIDQYRNCQVDVTATDEARQLSGQIVLDPLTGKSIHLSTKMFN